jgi:hypothetical protein
VGSGGLGPDAREQFAGGLVVGVLGDELAGEGAGEDGLAEGGAAEEVALDGLLQGVEDGEAALDFGDDAELFFQRRQRDR